MRRTRPVHPLVRVATGLVALMVPGLRRAVTEPEPADHEPSPQPVDASVGTTRGENA